MTLINYFSKDANKRAKFINKEINIKGKKVLDVGTGTGAWADMFVRQQAKEVYAVDLSPRMLDEGQKKHPEITFLLGDAESLSDLEDNSFDIVTASFVLHGVKEDRRRKILSEMKRVSRKHVVINDFSGKTDLSVGILEFFERSDFRNFKARFCDELKSLFPMARKIETGDGNGLYFAEKK